MSALRSAALWSYALASSRMIMTTMLAFVLAAILGPRSFGLIAMALAFVGLVELLLRQGLLPAIVQRKELRPEHVDTAFWAVIVAGLVLTLAAIFLAPVWAETNGIPELKEIIWALSTLVPLQSLVVVPEALLRRELRFKSLALRDGVATATGGVAGLVAALQGLGVWALVLQQIVTAAVAVVVLWAVSPWRPSWRFERSAARQLYAFSLKSSVASLGLFVGNRADVLIAGAFFGPVIVGIFRLAQRLTDVALEVTARAMQAVALPGLAELQSVETDRRRRLSQMQRITVALSLPLLGIVAGAATPIVQALGPEWADATAAIRALCLAQAFTALSLLVGPAMQAIGRPGRLAWLTWARAGLLMVGYAAAGVLVAGQDPSDQLVVMLATATVGSALTSAAALMVLSQSYQLSAADLFSAWRPGLVAALVGLSTSLGLAWLTAPSPVMIQLGVVLCGSAFLACCSLALQLPELRAVARGALSSRHRSRHSRGRHSSVELAAGTTGRRLRS